MSGKLIAVLIIILIVFWFFLKRNCYLKRIRGLSIKNIDDVQFHTGDIVLTSRNLVRDFKPLGFFSVNLIGSMLACGSETHSSMVVVVNGIPYTYQVAFESDYDLIMDAYVDNKPVLTPLKDYMLSYPGECILYSYNGPAVDQTKLDNFIETNKDLETDANLLRWMNMTLNLPVKDHPGVICSELVAAALHEIGLLDFDKPHLTTPTEIGNVAAKSPLYEKPVLLDNPYMKWEGWNIF